MGDSGADFYDGGKGGSQFTSEFWSIPTEDLSKIYATMNLTNETSAKIEKCTTLMYVGALLEHRFGDIATLYYANHTAFLTEELDLWFHGGLSDMGSQVQLKW